jgi:MFS family permease
MTRLTSHSMVHSSTWAQALSAPPYLVSFVAVLWAAYASDKKKSRSAFVMAFASLACAGYSLIFLTGLLHLPNWIRYLAVYPACAGFFCCVTLIITWTLNNQDSESKKGAGIALLQYLGQCGPLVGTRLFPAEDGPLYSKGMLVCAIFMGGVAVMAFALRIVILRENVRRSKIAAYSAVDEDAERLVGQPNEPASKVFLLMV